jgi:hypothetical protein
MKINIEAKFEIKDISVKLGEGKIHENFLAYASLKFEDENNGYYFTISGFSIWKSKYGGYNVETPKKVHFTYFLSDKVLMQKIRKAIIEKYEYEKIPVIEN